MGRIRIIVQGVVQGVGFRPLVFRTALKHNLHGFVRNQLGEVVIEVEGNGNRIEQFLREIQIKAEPPAKINSIQIQEIPSSGGIDFEIKESKWEGQHISTTPPDLSVCGQCIEDIRNPTSRFYSYPLTSCTYCGPRYSIIHSLPYDRKQTTMDAFLLCQECLNDYKEPLNRRYHAQTIACANCGPQVLFWKIKEESASINWLEQTDYALQNGSILALKGIGGFHLICDATQASSVLMLRNRKQRVRKPLAIMAKDIKTIQDYFHMSESEQDALTGKQGIILLLTPNENGKGYLPVAELAPGYSRLGVMLPYTPMHQMLFGKDRNFLVVTSGNRSGQSIARTMEEARLQLSEIADAIVTHEREIYIRVEDSVGQVTKEGLQLLRRSRGYVPEQIPCPLPPGLTSFPAVLGTGAEWKNTFCLLNAYGAVMSQHIGDVANEEQLMIWRESVMHLCRVMNESPLVIGYDPHPAFLLTEEVQERMNTPIAIPVYHHHAHLASCMAEHMLTTPVIGCILDGTGYGPDQTLWGFEILTGDYVRFERAIHMEALRLPGGEAAIKKPWMMGMSLLAHAFDKDHDQWKHACKLLFPSYQDWSSLVWNQLIGCIPAPSVTSAGRLFDGVASLLGLTMENSYEGEAAILLGELAEEYASKPYMIKTYSFTIDHGEIQVKDTLQELVSDILKGVPVGQVALAFHKTIVEMIIKSVMIVSKETAIMDVVLSGGVWANRLLLTYASTKLRQLGMNVYTQLKVPPGDGGISLGQAVVALWRWTQHVSVSTR